MREKYHKLLAALALAFVPAMAAHAQSTKLRVRYYLPDSVYTFKVGGKPLTQNTRHLAYYRSTRVPAVPRQETVTITTQSGAGTETITRTTTTPVRPGATSTVRTYSHRAFDPQNVAFFVEHKKDTLILDPIPWQDTTKLAPSSDEQFFSRGITTKTFYVPINPQYGYTTLRFKMREFGVMLLPFRVYAGKKYQPVIGVGGAAYYGWTRGTRYFYADGTSVALSHMWGIYGGFTKVKVTPDNSSNKVQKETTEPAATVGVTYLFGREELKIGPVVGMDIPLTGKANKWDYAFKPYLGVSLSLSISALEL